MACLSFVDMALSRLRSRCLVGGILCLLITLTQVTHPILADVKGDESNPCVSKETCGECITSHPECAWCTQPNFSSLGQMKRRCDYVSNLHKARCHESHIYHPVNKMEKIVDEDLSNKTTSMMEAIQFRPQRVSLRLKPNSPYTIRVQFRQAVDYPVDLYYLMDLSKSMQDDKAKLAELGNALAANMQRITSNFRLGFGSFVDKVVMPYVSTVPEKLKEPCSECAAPYGFKNHMPLDTDSLRFTREVNETQISGNLDAPEGGFDAIMQTIVCKNQIGWREQSRKLLLFSTDSGFHYAGDGKLGGIVKPNDGECHLDRQGLYTESTTQDYPSISQINQKVQENHVNVIFAVTENQYGIYQRLIPLVEGASAGKLENDSSNIVELVEAEYLKITSSVELKDNATSNIRVSYYSSCLEGRREETNICNGLRVGTTVSFDVELEILSCPRKPSEWNQTIRIYPVGLNDALLIDLTMSCECDCEKPWNEERNSDKCSGGYGTYECGICSCYGNRYGKECECDAKEADPAKDELQCFRDRNDTKVCSGRGVCRCGVCECFSKSYEERIYGQYCECDNFSCDRVDGKICGGPDHGECDCGTCKCNDKWTGPACECLKSQDDCFNPESGKICSGRGECVCGVCKCFPPSGEGLDGMGQYTGLYCEECPTCPTQCEAFKECVQCQIFGTGPLDEEDCRNCSYIAFDTEKFEVESEAGEKLCVFIDDDDCKFQFKYKYDSDQDYMIITVQRAKDCPTPVNVLAIVIAVILGIVLIGLALLLIWKLLTTIHDRREFAKFEKDRQNAKWDTGENPIYKQATTTFKNPTYGGKQ